MSERASVDPSSGTIRLGGKAWRFDWLPASGEASIELDGRTYRLDGIEWRQKRWLARARPYLESIRPALARACLKEPSPMPADGDAAEALAALAEWLTTSESALPWDAATLARATIEICRTAGLKPGDLDGLAAVEVEELWAAARAEWKASEAQGGTEAQAGAPDSAPPPKPGLKRIVVLPDPLDKEGLPAQHQAPSTADAALPEDGREVPELPSLDGPLSSHAPIRTGPPSPERSPAEGSRTDEAADGGSVKAESADRPLLVGPHSQAESRSASGWKRTPSGSPRESATRRAERPPAARAAAVPERVELPQPPIARRQGRFRFRTSFDDRPLRSEPMPDAETSRPPERQALLIGGNDTIPEASAPAAPVLSTPGLGRRSPQAPGPTSPTTPVPQLAREAREQTSAGPALGMRRIEFLKADEPESRSQTVPPELLSQFDDELRRAAEEMGLEAEV